MINESAIPGTKARASAGKYLTFRLGNESYGIDGMKVREIIRLTDITAVPQMPSYIKGIINLRGKIVPVADLRVKFGLHVSHDVERACIVVAETATTSQVKALIGLIVDAVEEVAQIPQDAIEPTPDFGTAVNTDYIVGMAKIKGAVKILLDIEKVVSTAEIESTVRQQAIAS